MFEVDERSALQPRPPDGLERGPALFGPYAEVYVARRPQPRLRIQPSRRQTLQEDGLDARRAQTGEDVLDLPLLERRLEGLGLVEIFKGDARRRLAQARVAHTPPRQRRRPRTLQRREYVFEFLDGCA